jgi:serine/threonine protein kinase
MSTAGVERRVGRFEILRPIGRGGVAVVYLARQTDLDREVALKELARFHATDATQAERFLRESRLAGSITHPNVVAVHDYFEWEGLPYIAMEYFEQGSLRPFVRNLGLPQVVGVLEGVLAGLALAESRGSCTATSSPRT